MAKAYVKHDYVVTGRDYVETDGGDTPGGGISYSTEEQDTGLKWVDGKKIYQITFTGTTSATGDNTIIGNAAGIDTVLTMTGYIKGTGRILTGFVNNTNYAGFYYSTESANISVWFPDSSIFHGKETAVTIQYTKTE